VPPGTHSHHPSYFVADTKRLVADHSASDPAAISRSMPYGQRTCRLARLCRPQVSCGRTHMPHVASDVGCHRA
jgi:hypothetical protein